MFRDGIMGRELVGPFRVPEGVKMTLVKYIEFLTTFFHGTKRRTVTSTAKSSSCMTMHHLTLQRIPLCHWLLWS